MKRLDKRWPWSPRSIQIVTSIALALISLGAPELPARAQKGQADSTEITSSNHRLDVAPRIQLSFEKQGVIPAAPGSSKFEQFALCMPGGPPVADLPGNSDPAVPEGVDEMTFYILDPKGAIAIHPPQPRRLYGALYTGYLVGNSTVLVHFIATPDSTIGNHIEAGPKGRSSTPMYVGAFYQFMMAFDPEGRLKATLKFPHGYYFHRFTQLPSGKFIAVAWDKPNKLLQLLLLNSQLRVIRSIEIPRDMKKSPSLRGGHLPPLVDNASAIAALRYWRFARVRGGALLYEARSREPVVEISPDGETREVTVQIPAGYELNNVIDSDGRWLMQFRRPGLHGLGWVDFNPQTEDSVLFEVSPANGALLRQIDLPAVDSQHPAYILACVQNGILTAFPLNKNETIRYTANLSR